MSPIPLMERLMADGTVALRALPAESVTVIPKPGITEGASLLWIGSGCVACAVILISFLILGRGRSRATTPRFGNAVGISRPTMGDALRDAVFRGTERLLRTDARHYTAKRLERAGLRLQVGELVMIVAATVLVFAGVGFLWRGLFGSMVGVGAGLVLPRFVIDQRFRRRKAAFEDGLPDVLSSIANVLRVGYSLNVGLGTVAQEYEDPISSELTRALNESRVSGSLTDSLRGVAERMDSVDLRWVIDAIEINATVGGDLVEVLEKVAATIRARARLNAQVSALTAEARMSALVLFVLPPGLGVFIGLTNPQYFDGIWGTNLTYWMIGLITAMLGAGGLWIRNMINAAVL